MNDNALRGKHSSNQAGYCKHCGSFKSHCRAHELICKANPKSEAFKQQTRRDEKWKCHVCQRQYASKRNYDRHLDDGRFPNTKKGIKRGCGPRLATNFG